MTWLISQEQIRAERERQEKNRLETERRDREETDRKRAEEAQRAAEQKMKLMNGNIIILSFWTVRPW